MKRFTTLLIGALGLLLWTSPAQAQGPGMPDPRAMSGISRVDPQLPAGEITVRCLNGSFAEPAIGVEVSLALTGPDGSQAQRKVTTVEQGRATFTGLAAFIGGSAIASVSFDGTVVSSQPIALSPQGGSRLLLVRGASSSAAAPPPMAGGGNPHGGGGNPHAGTAADGLPPFGEAFPLPGRPAGTIVVGALVFDDTAKEEQSAITPQIGTMVELFVVPADAAPDAEGRPLAKAPTDDEGRVSFKDLEVAPNERVVAQVVLGEAKELRRSKPFDISQTAVAVVMVDEKVERTIAEQSRRAQQARAAQDANAGPRPRPALPPVSRDMATPKNAVRVAVVDGDDQPVAGQSVSVVRIDASGSELRLDGETGANGVALVEKLSPSADGLFYAEVIYDGAPYKTALFELPEDVGARASLRVFPRTTDPTRVKSALHFEFDGLENDKLRLLIGYEVLVSGDAAFWPDGGMQLQGPEGVSVAKPMPESGRWLEEVEGAPFAKLKAPLPPGEVAKLSMAYVLSHDGKADIEWTAPFPLMNARAVLKTGQGMLGGGNGTPGEVVTPEHMGNQSLTLYDLEVKDGSVPSTLVAVQVDGFKSRPRHYWYAAIGVGAAILFIAGIAIATAPRRSRREELLERKQLLLERLEALDRVEAPAADRDKVVQALELVYRQLDALSEAGKSSQGARA